MVSIPNYLPWFPINPELHLCIVVVFIIGSKMYKKVRPQGNIMIEVFKCIGVSIIFITKNSYSNFKNCLVYLPKSEICHNMRTLESFNFFFSYRRLLTDTSRFTGCLCIYLYLGLYLNLYTKETKHGVNDAQKLILTPGNHSFLICIPLCSPAERDKHALTWVRSRATSISCQQKVHRLLLLFTMKSYVDPHCIREVRGITCQYKPARKGAKSVWIALNAPTWQCLLNFKIRGFFSFMGFFILWQLVIAQTFACLVSTVKTKSL